MPKHRQESGRTPKTALRESLLNSFRPRTDKNTSGVSTRNKVAAAVVAAGAFAAVGQPLAANAEKTPAPAVQPVADRQAAPAHLPASPAPATQKAAQQLDKSKAIAAEQAKRAEAAKAEAAKQAAAPATARTVSVQQAAAKTQYVKPAEGTFTSGFGSRWGSTHKGIDIANSIGTPIKAVTDGEVINAGPASGFGQWVRLQHSDGTITVYGHVNTIDVQVGQQVKAGEQIATIGNRGQSTGPHLHFEVIENGSKINPLPWLQERGISVK